jgi:hypothetical protein
MLSQVSEIQMRRVRWAMAIAWLLMIVSLFYDPISPGLIIQESLGCIPLQGQCADVLSRYAIAPRVFWGMVVPSSIFIVFILGHETWRRICPLYFMSQISRALGFSLNRRVAEHSWLGQNHLYLQFGLFFLGLCARILLINSDRVLLGLFLLGTIALAITVVFIYGGRSWCHYVCPFGMVQTVFTGPRGLFDSKAHVDPPESGITQSMCRTVENGQEQSACVGCKSPCLDIDSERAYWHQLGHQPGRRFVQYGYLGLVLGYFVYYGLYAGNFQYYFSGVWSHERDQVDHLWDAGFYLWGNAIDIPKLYAVPLTLGGFGIGVYLLGLNLERWYRGVVLSRAVARHRVFSIVTFCAFNLFFIYGGKPELQRLPYVGQYGVQSGLMFLSTVWLMRTWPLSPERYGREGLAEVLSEPEGILERTVVRKGDGDRMVQTVVRR